jgi:hypothetical protein
MSLQRAVSHTISYASFFRFPLLPAEIHRWLIYPRLVSHHKLESFLPDQSTSSVLRLRAQTTYHSNQKTIHAQKLLKILKYLPGLRLVALTGSVAANNAQKNDDIDLLFITAPHTLWLVRPLVIVLISLFFRRRHPQEDHTHAPDAFCPNLWLDTFSLAVPLTKRSLYTAHEVLQIKPLLDRGDTYQRFLQANLWTKKYLANAYTSLVLPTSRRHSDRVKRVEKSHSIIQLLFAPFNLIFFVFQFIYMYPKKTTETVNPHAAFLHTTDFSGQLNRYLKRTNNI